MLIKYKIYLMTQTNFLADTYICAVMSAKINEWRSGAVAEKKIYLYTLNVRRWIRWSGKNPSKTLNILSTKCSGMQFKRFDKWKCAETKTETSIALCQSSLWEKAAHKKTTLKEMVGKLNRKISHLFFSQIHQKFG